MAKTPANAVKLLTDMVPAATAKARDEAARCRSSLDAEHGGFTPRAVGLAVLRRAGAARRDTTSTKSQLKPYFELDRVLKDGVFFAANELYGLTFKERQDLPVYHPDVRVFEVFDANGKSLALFYADYFKRDNKTGGAWDEQLRRPERACSARSP